MSLNLVTLVGRAGIDPQVKYFESNSVLCEVTLAVNRIKRDDDPDWFNLKMWGKTAEIAANYVKKGKLIGIQGALEIETWTDRNSGAPRSKPTIRVSRLELLGSKRDNEAPTNNYDGYGGGEF